MEFAANFPVEIQSVPQLELAMPMRPIALARHLHDTVVQRLAGLSLVLSIDGPFDQDERSHCQHEIVAALAELRTGLEGMLGDEPVPVGQFEAEMVALAQEHPCAFVDVSALMEIQDPRTQAIVDQLLAEGVRNARKHASPTQVCADVDRDEETLTVTLRNDGACADGGGGCGMGLRLLEVEASLAGGLIQSGPDDQEGWWRLRLILPIS